jgi:hypothetical protein
MGPTAGASGDASGAPRRCEELRVRAARRTYDSTMKRARAAGWLVALVVAAAGACGDQVIEHHPIRESSTASTASLSSASGGGGAGVTSVSVGHSGSTTTTHGAGGQATSVGAGGAGGEGGGFGCLAGGEFFIMTVAAFDGSILGCGTPTPTSGDTIVEGKVIDTGPGFFTVDSCDGACSPEVTTVTYGAPGLAPTIPIDDLVRVVAHVDAGWQCSQQLLVYDLPTWGDLTNPLGADGTLRLAAAEGTSDVSPEAPFTTQIQALGCTAGNVFPFKLFFQLNDSFDAIFVDQEQTATWDVDVSPAGTTWDVHDLRSYRTTNSNDDSNWGYWVAQTPPVPPP